MGTARSLPWTETPPLDRDPSPGWRPHPETPPPPPDVDPTQRPLPLPRMETPPRDPCPGQRPQSVCGQTDTRENITFANFVYGQQLILFDRFSSN